MGKNGFAINSKVKEALKLTKVIKKHLDEIDKLSQKLVEEENSRKNKK